jgi:hypothetical protein
MTKRGYDEAYANAAEFKEDITEKIRTIWRRIEEYYGEDVELVLEPHHSRRYGLRADNGKVIIGLKDIHVYYDRINKRIIPRWKYLLESLLEEYIHTIHYRRIRNLPPILVSYRPHSDEIFTRLEVQRSLAKIDFPLSDEERETIEISKSVEIIGLLENLARKLADFSLYQGDIERAKAIIKEYTNKPAFRYDWDLYLRRRARELQEIVEDLRDNLEYDIRYALIAIGAEPLENWQNYGNISSRAMELLGLL